MATHDIKIYGNQYKVHYKIRPKKQIEITKMLYNSIDLYKIFDPYILIQIAEEIKKK